MKVNKKLFLLIASSLLVVFLMSFVSAALCKGNDGYYHDCESYKSGYNHGFYDGYKTGYSEGYYDSDRGYVDYSGRYPTVKKTYTKTYSTTSYKKDYDNSYYYKKDYDNKYYYKGYDSHKILDYNKCVCKEWNRNGICVRSVCQKEYYKAYSPIRYSLNWGYR